MTQVQPGGSDRPSLPDLPTLIAVSALAYIGATALHEHAGHGLSCLLLGGHISEAGAFYVDCAHTSLTDAGVRLVALAGPLVSLLTGVVGFVVLRRLPPSASIGRYFAWLLGTIGLMEFTGYLLFSGITGLGDFGTGPDGATAGLQPAGLWQIALIVSGLLGYFGVILYSVRNFDGWVGGSGVAKIRHARMLTLVTYLTGAAAAVLIGLLNPHGLVIVLTSAAASSLGATSGFLWMMQLLDRKKESSGPFLTWGRAWGWIAVSAVFVVVYAAILGPTVRAP